MATFTRSSKQESHSKRNETRETKFSGQGGQSPTTSHKKKSRHVTFLFDASGSMSAVVPGTSQTRLTAISEAAKLVLKHMHEQDTITVTVFADRSKTLAEGIQKANYDAAQVANASGTAGYCTEMWAALWLATEGARRSPDTFHQIVLFTDGGATDSSRPIKTTVVDWLQGAPSNIKLFFITSEITASDKAALAALPPKIVQLSEIGSNFNGLDLTKVFSAVSNTMKQNYASYISTSSSSKKKTTSEETWSSSLDPNVVEVIRLAVASGNAAVATHALDHLARMSANTIAQGNDATGKNGTVLPWGGNSAAAPLGGGASRLAIGGPSFRPQSAGAPRQLLTAPPAPSARPLAPGEIAGQWTVRSDFAGYMIRQVEHKQIKEMYSVQLEIPSKPVGNQVIRQTWVIIGRHQAAIEAACAELDAIVAKKFPGMQ